MAKGRLSQSGFEGSGGTWCLTPSLEQLPALPTQTWAQVGIDHMGQPLGLAPFYCRWEGEARLAEGVLISGRPALRPPLCGLGWHSLGETVGPLILLTGLRGYARLCPHP